MLVNAVRGYHQTYHLLEMLTLLNYWTKKLLKKRGQLNEMMPYVTHTLRHEVRFGKSSQAKSITDLEMVGEGCTPFPRKQKRWNYKHLCCFDFGLYSLIIVSR